MTIDKKFNEYHHDHTPKAKAYMGIKTRIRMAIVRALAMTHNALSKKGG